MSDPSAIDVSFPAESLTEDDERWQQWASEDRALDAAFLTGRLSRHLSLQAGLLRSGLQPESASIRAGSVLPPTAETKPRDSG